METVAKVEGPAISRIRKRKFLVWAKKGLVSELLARFNKGGNCIDLFLAGLRLHMQER
jgi:hypothetical protein